MKIEQQLFMLLDELYNAIDECSQATALELVEEVRELVEKLIDKGGDNNDV